MKLTTLGASLAALALGTSACSSSTPETCEPPNAHATFRMTVKAPSGPLPDKVIITIKYGGSGEEIYDARFPNITPQVVFCKQEREGGVEQDASQPDMEAIVCDLWTDGAATVKIEAEGYADLERNLKAETDKCGLKLTEETLTLEVGD
jgi:hypothetical protein